MKKNIIILFVSLIIILLILFLIKYLYNIYKSNLIDNNNNDENNSHQIVNLNYLTMTELDFNKLNIATRWIYRSECLKNFNEFKFDYNKKNFIFPLPMYEKNNLIFVNLASYRDIECNKTIKSLFYNSNNYKNLRIVVCEQNSEEDLDCLKNLESKYLPFIKVIRLSYKEARGPTWARFLIQQMYNKEEYYLQIDSHTIFENKWDIKLKNCLNSLPDKSCLTQYLPDYEIGNFKTIPKLRHNLNVSRICSLDGFTRITAKYINPNIKYDKPFKSNGWSGCFSFSKGDICFDAPIDCYTPDVFFGEEMDIALRLFTRGWNFYAPHFPIAYTNFNRSYRETFWEKKGIGYNKNITLCSRLRIHYRLGTLPIYLKEYIENIYKELLIEIDKFKLGNLRTLDDYENLIKFRFSSESSF